MMSKRKIGVSDLAGRIGITLPNLSVLKNNKARAIRFSTLDAICRELSCQPGDILEYVDKDSPEAKNANRFYLDESGE